jgi:hypothetical protein
MKKLLPLVLLLSACGHTDTGLAPQIQVPPLPENLAKKATALPASADVTMGGQVKDNTANIQEYNAKAFQLNDVIDLYNCVRDAINNKKEIKCQ